MMTITPFRKATVAMFACAFGAILLDTTPAHAQVGLTACGGDACAQVDYEGEVQPGSNSIEFDLWSTVAFTGHFQLQKPDHTQFNSLDEPWNAGGPIDIIEPFELGQYCFTAWKYLGRRGAYQKIGGTCFNITS